MTESIERKNNFCVISLECNENGWYDIQDNSSWSAIPYENFAEVPDEMVKGVKATCGYLVPTFNDERTMLVDYTPTEIPVFPESEPLPTQLDMIEAQVVYTAMMTDTLLEV